MEGIINKEVIDAYNNPELLKAAEIARELKNIDGWIVAIDDNVKNASETGRINMPKEYVGKRVRVYVLDDDTKIKKGIFKKTLIAPEGA